MADANPRVLILSPRNIASKRLARCMWFEFEDVVAKIDDTHLIAPGRLARFDLGYRLAGRTGRHVPIALDPGVERVAINRKYDLFFAACAFPTDLLYLASMPDFRDHCRVAVCWIDELLLNELHLVKYLPRVLSRFDHVIVSCQQVVDTVKRWTNCDFVLPGVDTLLFSENARAARPIDVLSIGRRSERLHERLLLASREHSFFYMYDTISSLGCKFGLTTDAPAQHREMFANLVKRTKYFLVNAGKFDEVAAVGNEEIIGARYFEGASGGAVLIGRRPRHPEFDRYFPWSDVVIEIEPDADINETFAALERQPARTRRASRDNVAECLLRHDWAYRWEYILQLAGLPPLPQLRERQRQLAERAAAVRAWQLPA